MITAGHGKPVTPSGNQALIHHGSDRTSWLPVIQGHFQSAYNAGVSPYYGRFCIVFQVTAGLMIGNQIKLIYIDLLVDLIP
jgi:hypothetical protein